MTKDGCITFSEGVTEWLEKMEQTQKVSTVANYRLKARKYFIPYFKEISVSQITPEMIDEFKSFLLHLGLSRKYLSNILSCFKVLMNYICATYHLANPISSLSLRSYTEQEDAKKDNIVEYPIDKLQDVLWSETDITKTGILLVLSTGIKLGELCALKWKDIDINHLCIMVSDTVQRVQINHTTKLVNMPCGHSRSLPISPKLQPVLKILKREPIDYFLSGGTTPIEPRNMQYRLRKLLVVSNLPDITFSALRTIFIQQSINQGMDVFTLANLLGVSNIDHILTKIQSSKSSSSTSQNKCTNYEIF